MKRILVLGAGFAGLWSAAGAARALVELKTGEREVEVTVVNRDAWHNIRVRNYESDLHGVRVPLDQVLGPIGVKRIEGEVAGIDFIGRRVTVRGRAAHQTLPYDRLVFALGSRLVRPAIPGFDEYAFDVDTYAGGMRLNHHISELPMQPASPGQYTALIVGSGLTGIEAATEIAGKLHAAIAHAGAVAKNARPRVILADHSSHIGSDMGDSARPVIAEALAALGVETRTGVAVTALDSWGATLASREIIAAATIVWCAGMHASPLTELFPVERDRFGRVAVDEFMKVKGMENVFAAGDVAVAQISNGHASVMSCQHGRPMGRFAGHNAVCDLLGKPMLPLHIDWYTTILDLGAWGALYTEGWNRHVVTTGAAAKKTKQMINQVRIYPPRSENRGEILAAAAPMVQTPPQRFS
ncbi:MAG TPA: FAD-dependent oxidoreductase [Burkholderiales bacterium]|nr:FAD-dependent oxidoreductase [Burkholderiales bacterium]